MWRVEEYGKCERTHAGHVLEVCKEAGVHNVDVAMWPCDAHSKHAVMKPCMLMDMWTYEYLAIRDASAWWIHMLAICVCLSNRCPMHVERNAHPKLGECLLCSPIAIRLRYSHDFRSCSFPAAFLLAASLAHKLLRCQMMVRQY